jgi:hypothetical protein
LRRLLICAGLLAVPAATNLAQQTSHSRNEHDPRLTRLRAFFDHADSPLAVLAEDFLAVADRYGLDWRLLPSISLVETGCGRTAVGHNIFGWDSGRKKFASFREAIHTVASRLGQSRLYRGKNLTQLLAMYNPKPRYGVLVKSVMRKLGPAGPSEVPLAVEAQLSPAF